jgi:hypothetical protein
MIALKIVRMVSSLFVQSSGRDDPCPVHPVQAVGVVEGSVRRQEIRGADRLGDLGEQEVQYLAHLAAFVAAEDRQIHLGIVAQGVVSIRRQHHEADLRVAFAEAVDQRLQPEAGHAIGGRDGDGFRAVIARDDRHGGADRVQPVADGGMKADPFGGQFQRIVLAQEQVHPKRAFQQADLLTDCALRHVQFPRQREAEMLCRHLECRERPKRGQVTALDGRHGGRLPLLTGDHSSRACHSFQRI